MGVYWLKYIHHCVVYSNIYTYNASREIMKS